MNDWRFDDAQSAITSVERTIANANAVAGALPTVSVAASPLQGMLASATTLADVTEIQSVTREQLATANLLAA